LCSLGSSGLVGQTLVGEVDGIPKFLPQELLQLAIFFQPPVIANK
jgi:hypothetical protein